MHPTPPVSDRRSDLRGLETLTPLDGASHLQWAWNPGQNQAGGITRGTRAGDSWVCVGAQRLLAAVRRASMGVCVINPNTCNLTW